MTIINDTHSSTLPAFVELFTLDCSAIGGTLFHFTPSIPGTGNFIQFNGVQYSYIPIEFTGAEYTSNGQQPRPTLKVSNVSKVLLSAVISLGDLVGARLTRTRTFEKYLDGQPAADSSQHLPIETFFVGVKRIQNKAVIEFELVTALERTQVKIPREQITRRRFPGVGAGRVRA